MTAVFRPSGRVMERTTAETAPTSTRTVVSVLTTTVVVVLVVVVVIVTSGQRILTKGRIAVSGGEWTSSNMCFLGPT